MIKVEVIAEFNLKDFDKLKNIIRKNKDKNEKGKLYEGDTFECSKEMCEYLTGKNPIKKIVVKIIEIKPEKVEESKEEKVEEEVKIETPKKSKKKKSSKK